MSAASLVAEADQDLVGEIRATRSLRLSWRLLLLPGVAALAVVAGSSVWDQVAQRGHGTALTVAAVVAGVMAISGVRRLARRHWVPRYALSPSQPLTPTRVGLIALLTGGPWLAAWWLVQQEGRWAGVALGILAVPLILELMAIFLVLLPALRAMLQRARARDAHAKARLAEQELEDIAWAIANRRKPSDAALRRWLGRLDDDLARSIEISPRVLGKDRGLTGIDGWWPDHLAAGLRRTLPDGSALLVQPVEGESSLVVTTPAGEVLEVSGLGRRLKRRYDWESHASAVAVARLVAGPTTLINAACAGPLATSARTQALLAAGGGEQPVPVGCHADHRVRLGEFLLRASFDLGDERRRQPRMELLVSPPAPVPPPRLDRHHAVVREAVEAVVPGVVCTGSNELGLTTLCLTQPGSERIVHAVPLSDPTWAPRLPEDHTPGLVVFCPELELVFLDDLFLGTDRAKTIAAIVALLQGEEQPLREQVWRGPKGTYDEPRPKRDAEPIELRGWRLGELTVWSPEAV